MSRTRARTSGERRSKGDIVEKVEKYLEDDSEVASAGSEEDRRSRRRWTVSEDVDRRRRESFADGGAGDETENDSSVTKQPEVPLRSSERRRIRDRTQSSHSHDLEEFSTGRKRRERQGGKRRRNDQSQEVEEDRPTDNTVAESLKKYRGEGDGPRKSRRKRELSREDIEIPITEILRRSEETARTKYEEPAPLPQLTTDRIYVQGKNGFTAVKIDASRTSRRARQVSRRSRRGRRNSLLEDSQRQPHIRAAIASQRIWKCSALVFQGLLAGMAFLHFLMLQVFFISTVEFLREYSVLSEIYGSIFSFLIALCIVSIMDKFDLARLDLEHAREIYANHAKSALAVPLYLAAFCLHQATVKTDDWLALIHYQNANESVWTNATTPETFLQELTVWERITISKDLLTVLAWLFVSLGTREDMLLTHLESMEKYANNIESK